MRSKCAQDEARTPVINCYGFSWFSRTISRTSRSTFHASLNLTTVANTATDYVAKPATKTVTETVTTQRAGGSVSRPPHFK